jgi:hypothetical protein
MELPPPQRQPPTVPVEPFVLTVPKQTKRKEDEGQELSELPTKANI